MSENGGCIVCGVTLGRDEGLRCSDCVGDHYMEQTGTKARYVRLTDEGPVDYTEAVEKALGATDKRRLERLESAVLAAYVGVTGLLSDIHPRPGPNGHVQWARTKHVRDGLKAALDDTKPDTSGTDPMVLP